LLVYDGTVVEGGDITKKLDLSRVFIEIANEDEANYLLEFHGGEVTFSSAEKMLALYYRTTADKAQVVSVSIPSHRVPCNYKIWARTKCQIDSAAINFLVELHTYDG